MSNRKFMPVELKEKEFDSLDIRLLNKNSICPSSFDIKYKELLEKKAEELIKAIEERRDWSDKIKATPEFKDPYKSMREGIRNVA